MKILIIILFFASCKQTEKKELGLTVSDSDRITKLESMVSKLVADSVYQAKQIAALKKNDSTYNLKVNSEAKKLGALIYTFSSDSINQWKKINLVYPLISKFPKDSAKQWLAIKSALLTPRFTSDSVKQWAEINKLKTASPVTQIPVMQSQIKTLQSKDVAQDVINLAQTVTNASTKDSLKIAALQTQVITAQSFVVTELSNVRTKNDSLQNLILKYAVIPDSTQIKITSGVMTIPGLVLLKAAQTSLQNRVAILEGMKPPAEP